MGSHTEDPAPEAGKLPTDVAVIGALALELDRQPGDLQLEVVDELEAGVDVAPPRAGSR
jgi:hypothetical protein